MSDDFEWGPARFVGEWTLDEVVAFVKRVGEIAEYEREAATLTAKETADFDAACREEGLR